MMYIHDRLFQKILDAHDSKLNNFYERAVQTPPIVKKVSSILIWGKFTFGVPSTLIGEKPAS